MQQFTYAGGRKRLKSTNRLSSPAVPIPHGTLGPQGAQHLCSYYSPVQELRGDVGALQSVEQRIIAYQGALYFMRT